MDAQSCQILAGLLAKHAPSLTNISIKYTTKTSILTIPQSLVPVWFEGELGLADKARVNDEVFCRYSFLW